MQFSKPAISMITSGLLLVIVMGIWIFSAQPVHAQCGSQASSCKNCHETQAQKPVNNDGTAWHTSHAFGDFCYLCHGGNNQSTDKISAHTGMLAPLKDVVTACKSCHAADFQAKAQIFATTLGATIETGSSAPAIPAATAPSGQVTPAAAAIAAPVAVIPAGLLVNYTQEYNESVLGKAPVNVGNVMLFVIIVLLLLGGGGYVILHERLVRFRFKFAFGDTRKVTDGLPDKYPGDVLDMLPVLAGLNPGARQSLKKILEKPEKTNRVLNLIKEIVFDPKTEE